MHITSIWIEAEESVADTWNPLDGNTDVIVSFDNGSRWVATFFSYQNIASLVKNYQQTGECLAGTYFWASDMILVDAVSRARIEAVVRHLVAEDAVTRMFARCPHAASDE